MAHNDVVSVTIVTYNSGRFIKRCLESVLAQRYRLKEIIVVDNASGDGTIDILEQFEDRCQIYRASRGFRSGSWWEAASHTRRQFSIELAGIHQRLNEIRQQQH